MASSAWDVVRFEESPGRFHARPLPDPVRRSAWICDAASSALVLGSAQPGSVVDREACERAGVEVVRRRSGGGAVLVVPGQLAWVDLLIPRSDPLWADDVGVAFGWVGGAWAAALSELGIEVARHEGAMVRSRWSDLVCFAGLGPGELTTVDGAKVVGLSQRRTREGARFQCAALLEWRPRAVVDLLALTPGERERAATDLAGAATGLDTTGRELLSAVLDHLP